MNQKPRISIIVPANNEELEIDVSVRIIDDAAKGWFSDYEILLIDDCSTDGTPQRMETLRSEHENVRVFRTERNLGFGGAYSYGLSHARFEYVTSGSPKHILPQASYETVFSHVGEADLVVSYLVDLEKRSRCRRHLSVLYTRLFNLFGFKLRYYNSTTVLPTELLRRLSLKNDGIAFQAEAIIRLLHAGYGYVECGIEHRSRTDLTSPSRALRLENLCGVFKSLCGLFLHIYIQPLFGIRAKIPRKETVIENTADNETCHPSS